MNEQHTTTPSIPLPVPLLCALSRGTQQENPTWSLLLANEYLESDHPLRGALTTQARSRFTAAQYSSVEAEAFEAACAGKTMGELSLETQQVVKQSSTACLHQKRKRFIPKPRLRVSQGQSGNPNALRSSMILS